MVKVAWVQRLRTLHAALSTLVTELAGYESGQVGLARLTQSVLGLAAHPIMALPPMAGTQNEATIDSELDRLLLYGGGNRAG
ncbi:MAG: hypothetical protein V4724_29850 [Pseudomonadota bacterium]